LKNKKVPLSMIARYMVDEPILATKKEALFGTSLLLSSTNKIAVGIISFTIKKRDTLLFRALQ
jgi:hypothetical protein